MSDDKATRHRLVEALAAGVVAGAIVYGLADASSIPVLGMNLSASTAVGSAVAISSFAADSLQHYVMPSAAGEMVGALAKPLVSGGTAAVTLGLIVGFDRIPIDGLAKIFGVGVVSEVSGSYLAGYVHPYLL
jgi:hypothetical protein